MERASGTISGRETDPTSRKVKTKPIRLVAIRPGEDALITSSGLIYAVSDQYHAKSLIANTQFVIYF